MWIKGSSLKYMISALFITAGLAVILLNDVQREMHSGEEAETINPFIPVSVDLDPFEERIADLGTKQQSNSQKRILPLIVLKTEACTPCLNNVTEFEKLLKEHPSFYEPTAVFTGSEEKIVNRFMITNGLEIPYIIINSETANPVFKEALQNLMFVDIERKTVISNSTIPNYITFTTHKENLLNEVSEMWTSVSESSD